MCSENNTDNSGKVCILNSVNNECPMKNVGQSKNKNCNHDCPMKTLQNKSMSERLEYLKNKMHYCLPDYAMKMGT